MIALVTTAVFIFAAILAATTLVRSLSDFRNALRECSAQMHAARHPAREVRFALAQISVTTPSATILRPDFRRAAVSPRRAEAAVCSAA